VTIFETERLKVREITQADVSDLATVLADPVVMEYSTVGVHSIAQIKDYIENCQKQYQTNSFGRWAIYDKHSKCFIGVCGINKQSLNNNEIVHINYRLATAQQGKGYATEAVKGMLSVAKNVLKLDHIYALIESKNENSVKVVIRTGFDFYQSGEFMGFAVDIYRVTL